MESDDLLLLAQRAASEGPRWTRAVEDQSDPIPGEVTNEFGRIIYIPTGNPNQPSHAYQDDSVKVEEARKD